ncbi:phosphoribosylglycinamide formyltransferase [Sporosarcina siberiensis]|uniref:Phosphoribosylglycinamide formyltransferase n=1 Tax=Sporosarcina siberiensis TaxID=1365606 RepID=A0ABW4SGH4_9BACL
MNNKVKIAVFASGSGSNFSALAEACKNGELNAEIVLLVTNKPDAYAIERAKKVGISALVVPPKSFESKDAYEQAILSALQESEVEWIVLAGYMRLIGPVLLSAYPSKIINIHPSLLPSFPGKDAIGQAIAHGVKVTGVTVHLVDAGMDTGPIIAQHAVDVVDGDVEKTTEAIHAVEHYLYKDALSELFSR